MRQELNQKTFVSVHQVLRTHRTKQKGGLVAGLGPRSVSRVLRASVKG